MSRLVDLDKYRKDLLSAYDDVSMEFEVLDRQPLVQAISLDKVKQAREKISDWDVNEVMDGCSEPFKRGVAKGLDIASVIIDKLIESED